MYSFRFWSNVVGIMRTGSRVEWVRGRSRARLGHAAATGRGSPLLRLRIMILKPFFDLFALGRQHHALPSHRAGSLAVLSHHVGVLIEHFDDAGSSRALETVAAKGRFVVLGGIGFFGNLPRRIGPHRTSSVRNAGSRASRLGWLRGGGNGSSLASKSLASGFHNDSGSPSCGGGSGDSSAWRRRSTFFAIFSCRFSFRCCSFCRF